MVILHVKHKDQSEFLFETTLSASIDTAASQIVAIYNGRLKIGRICSEIEELAKHGTLYPPEILGLTSEQVEEMKLQDSWGEKCIPSGGFVENPDPVGRRNGKQPRQEMQNVLLNACKEANEMVSKNLVKLQQTLALKTVQEAVNILKGAVTIVYPMKLPPHDVIRMEFENVEDLSGTQASLDVIDPTTAQLWFCGKEMYRDDGKVLRDYVGTIDKCKVIVKLTKRGQGPPGREPIMGEEERKELMMHAYHRQEQLKQLEADEDDSYYNSRWADGGNLKRTFQGIGNIEWKLGGRR